MSVRWTRLALALGDLVTRKVAGLSCFLRSARFWLGPVPVPLSAVILRVPQLALAGEEARAQAMYRGQFELDVTGTIQSKGGSPFAVEQSNPFLAQELHGFMWLRHIAASNSGIIRILGWAMVSDWINLYGHSRSRAGAPWAVPAAALRLMAWLAYSDLVAEHGDAEGLEKFQRALSRHVRFLFRAALLERDERARLLALVACVMAGLALEEGDRLLAAAQARLCAELGHQFSADGGVKNRNPHLLVEAVFWLRAVMDFYRKCRVPPPVALMHVLDRAVPMVRFFLHRDNGLALFNGVPGEYSSWLEALALEADHKQTAFTQAPHMGYYRLADGLSTLIFDAGVPAARASGLQAHASVLAFEFSHIRDRIVVNCGISPGLGPAWCLAGRRRAAHSTLELEGQRFGRFVRLGRDKAAARVFRGGARRVDLNIQAGADGDQLEMSQDGYWHEHGLVHCRQIRLSEGGRLIEGCDELRGKDKSGTRRVFDHREEVTYAVRFHLHPDVSVSHSRDNRKVFLTPGSGKSWLFESGVALVVEDSVYLGAGHFRRSKQIVLRGPGRVGARASWRFVRADLVDPAASGVATDSQIEMFK